MKPQAAKNLIYILMLYAILSVLFLLVFPGMRSALLSTLFFDLCIGLYLYFGYVRCPRCKKLLGLFSHKCRHCRYHD